MSYIEDNGYFTFGTLKSSDYGVWITGEGTYDAAARKFKRYSIPGRNGTLTIMEDAFEDITHEYPAFIIENFDARIQAFRNKLIALGKQKLVDTYHTDEYYMADYMEGLEVNAAPRGIAGDFKIKFNRDPRRFLNIGDVTTTYTTSGTTITNPTEFASKPKLRIFGYGKFYINSQYVTITQRYSYVDIDCETLDATYATSTSMNAYVEFNSDALELKTGTNTITWDSTITSVRVTPRWFRL